MTVGSDLRADHRVIRRLEATVREMSASIARGEGLPPDDIEEAIRLMVEFVDSYHHVKEETGLFPVVQGTAREQQKVVYSFLVEHEFGRRISRRIEREFDLWAKGKANTEPLSRFLLTYADFLRTHTQKEDAWFEEVDRRLLSQEQQGDVLGRFACIGGGTPTARKGFMRRVNKLARKYSR